MKKLITGFFMAWGNFITLPCPYKKWDNNLKNTMLAFLPSVGAVAGLCWAFCAWALRFLPGEYVFIIRAFIMVFVIFTICGFMHLDGFMDCNDAILSRRPLEERQRILKDSSVGAFAVVTVIFLIIGWMAAMTVICGDGPAPDYAMFLIIPVISRSIAGISVLQYKPIGHSQYVTDYEEPGKGKYYAAAFIQLIIVFVICVYNIESIERLIITAAVENLAAFAACGYARKQLGGMSGDIAGYTICIAEFAGVLTFALAAGFGI